MFATLCSLVLSITGLAILAMIAPLGGGTAEAAATPTFTSRASVSPPAVTAGQTASVSASFTSDTATTVMVGIEVYDAAGRQVFKQWMERQSVAAGRERTFTVPWSVPATAPAGTYAVRLGVLSADWRTLYHWNHWAATFTVRPNFPDPTATRSPASPTALPTSPPAPSVTSIAGAACPTGQYRAEYFRTRDLSGGPVFARCEAAIQNVWWSGGPGNGVPSDNFSVRWTGRHAFAAGTHAFTARADDGIRVWLGDALLVNEWRMQSPTTYQAVADLAAGEYQITVEYFEAGGDAQAQVSWQLSQPAPPTATRSATITAQPTQTPMVTSTPTDTPIPTPSPTPTDTPTVTDTAAPTATDTAAPTGTPTSTPRASGTAPPTASAAPTDTATTTITATASATVAPTNTFTPAATKTLTNTATPPPVSPSPTTSPPTTSTYRSVVLNSPGLAGYWRLGETSGTVAADISGRGRHGTIAPGGVARGQVGALAGDADGAMGFDGAAGHVRVPNASAGITGGSMSMEGWVFPQDRPAQHQGFFGFRNDADADFYVMQLAGTNTVEARFRGAWGAETTLTVPVTAGRWQHVVVTYHSVKQLLEVFVDGKLRAGTYGPGGTITKSTAPFDIGRVARGNDTSYLYAAGRVDEVAIYNTLLKASAILDRYDAATGVPRVQRTTSGDGPRWMGAYVYGVPGSPATLDEFAAMTGAMPPVVMWFQDWQHGGFNFDQMDLAASRNAIPMVSWMPSGDDWSRYTLARINAGEHDAYVRQWARDAAAWGQPFFLRFAHEMNGNWYPWSPGVNGNTAAEFVAAWRRVHGLFAQEGAANAVWVWSPNVEAGPGFTPTPLAAVYPGDAYVDWVGLDGYNWGDQPGWRSFAEVFGPSYAALTALTGKPLLIGETAAGEAGGDKAAWVRDAFAGGLAALPRVRGVVWFHEDKERDWRVNSSPAALAAYRDAVASVR